MEIIIYQADTFKPRRLISLATKLLFSLAQDQNLLALGNRVISIPEFVGGVFKSGHFNTPPNTRPVLCRIAPCECFGDAIAAFLGDYEVGQETESKFAPKNSPTVQFDATLTQSNAPPQNSPVQELKWGEWLQALGAVISGIIWVDNPLVMIGRWYSSQPLKNQK